MSEALEILLVEDNPRDTELTIRALRKRHLVDRLRVAKDGVEALDLLLPAKDADRVLPKMVLLDLKLPKVGGLEVLRRLKADPRTHRLPVVVLTSSKEDRDIEEAYRLGANSYIVKPVDFNNFAEVVSQLGLYWLLLNQPSSP